LTTLDELLPAYRDDLLRFVQRHAGRLLRYETAEDLLQGIHLRALERGGTFRYRGREPFLQWLFTMARQYLADRHAHWSALRRRPARLVRLTEGAGGVPGGGTGPVTFADRRDQLARAVRTLALLSARDRSLVQWASDGVPLREQATRLGLGYAAAKSASRRALDRFRKLYARLAG